jgi:UDP-galactose transporter B1
MVVFLKGHAKLFIDLFLMGVLSAFGQLFIYRLVKIFKQHIVPFIITTRKIFTVGLSIIYFEHKIALVQLLGLFIVFGVSIYEFIS